MACEDKSLLLHAYSDAELDLMRSMEIEEHVKTCAACAQQLRELQTLRKGIRSANLHHRAPESLRARLIAAAADSSVSSHVIKSNQGAGSRVRIVPRRPVIEWLAVAAAILIAVWLGMRFMPGATIARQGDLVAQEIVGSHIRSLQPGHLMDVVSTDQHTVKPWFNGKLDFSPPVRDMAEQGYALIGGRLDYVGGRDVAALVYQVRKHYINVFVWPDDGKQPKLPEFISKQGYNVVCQTNSAMHLCGVTDANADDLRQFMQLLVH